MLLPTSCHYQERGRSRNLDEEFDDSEGTTSNDEEDDDRLGDATDVRTIPTLETDGRVEDDLVSTMSTTLTTTTTSSPGPSRLSRSWNSRDGNEFSQNWQFPPSRAHSPTESNDGDGVTPPRVDSEAQRLRTARERHHRTLAAQNLEGRRSESNLTNVIGPTRQGVSRGGDPARIERTTPLPSHSPTKTTTSGPYVSIANGPLAQLSPAANLPQEQRGAVCSRSPKSEVRFAPLDPVSDPPFPPVDRWPVLAREPTCVPLVGVAQSFTEARQVVSVRFDPVPCDDGFTRLGSGARSPQPNEELATFSRSRATTGAVSTDRQLDVVVIEPGRGDDRAGTDFASIVEDDRRIGPICFAQELA